MTGAVREPSGSVGPDWVRAAPVLFVLIWSTGFIVARYGMPHAPPFSFLAWRFALSVLCFMVWLLVARAVWPRDPKQWLHLAVTGLLMQLGYLGGVWAAVKSGMSAGVSALIVGLQPLLTALWVAGVARSSQVSWRQWAGLLLGLAGLVLVVWRKMGIGEASPATVAMAVGALLAITAGTLYQKRWVATGDVRCAAAIQMMAALVFTLPLAWLETEPVRWNLALAGAMAWSVLALSLGANSLLVLLIQRGAATRVTSLLYLVPPCTAVMGWLLFGELLTPAVVLGMALCAAGVWMVLREPAAAPAAPGERA
jgi:drug/metabolite transporter (DMT)-like permease